MKRFQGLITLILLLSVFFLIGKISAQEEVVLQTPALALEKKEIEVVEKAEKIEEAEQIEEIEQTSSVTKDRESQTRILIEAEETNFNETALPAFQEALPIVPKKIFINELLANPVGDDTKGEWIELASQEDQTLSLEGWSLKDRSGKKFIFSQESIEDWGFLIIKYEKSKLNLNNDGDDIFLYNATDELVSAVSYEKAIEGKSWAKKSSGDFALSDEPTPAEKNIFADNLVEQYPPIDEEVEEKYVTEVYISEFLPNPSGLDKEAEWIEILNAQEVPINLTGWFFQNSAGSKFVIESQILNAKSFQVFYLKNTSFVIKNSNEKLKLFNPAGVMVNEVSFQTFAKDAVSLALADDLITWRWTAFLTPGQKNRFNRLPEIKISKEKKIYQNMATIFDAEKTKDADKDKLNFRWDFGDGARSYLKTTRHIYEKKGVYTVTLEVSDGTEIAVESFDIKVVDLDRPKLSILGFLPNPIAKDYGNEWIKLKNNSSKKVNLKGYKIATGKDEDSLTNHLILDEWILSAKGEDKIFNQTCRFSLLNQAGAVALVFPDGKIADLISYEKDKIEEDQSYELTPAGWQWQIATKGKQVLAINSDPKVAGIITKVERESKTDELFQQIKTALKEESFLSTRRPLSFEKQDWQKKNKLWLGNLIEKTERYKEFE